MVVPTVRVELIVPDPNAPYLTLDDPVRGEIDEASYPLFDGDPLTTVDLSADAYAYTIRRGRPTELDAVSTGTLGVALRNYSGTYLPADLDPSNTNVVPGKRVRIYLDEIAAFDGRVDDWELDYEVDGSASASLTAIDALGVLAESELNAWTTSAQTASERFEAVLDRPEVDFPANRSASEESGQIQADTVAAGTNALTYVRLVTYSDLGYVYASRLGVLTFESRQSITAALQAEFADDGTAIPFSGIKPSGSNRFLYNRISVTREGGTEQVVEDTTSQASYGIRSLTLTGLLMNSDTDALYSAQTLATLYAEPATRIESLTINLGSLDSSQRAQVLSLDLGDYVSVTWTPVGSSEITQSLRIEGIDLGGTFDGLGMMSLSLSPAVYFPDPFILDDLEFGVLDTSQIFY